MRRLTAIRLAAVLLPSALLLHEGVYALAGGIDRSAHDYFSLLVPVIVAGACLLYTSPSPRDGLLSRMPSSA